jgi:hypothetical protein
MRQRFNPELGINRRAEEGSHDADFVRCPICWGWIDRNSPRSQDEHRGPTPHPRNDLTALNNSWDDD